MPILFHGALANSTLRDLFRILKNRKEFKKIYKRLDELVDDTKKLDLYAMRNRRKLKEETHDTKHRIKL